MKRKKGPAIDLKAILEKAAAKKENQSQTLVEGNLNPVESNLNPSCNESQMQLVIYQGHHHENESCNPASSSTIPIDPEISDMPLSNDEFQSSDEDNDGGMYDIEHDPGLRIPISMYDVNDQDSVRRAYIAFRPCRPKMKKADSCNIVVEVCATSYQNGLMSSSGLSIVCIEMLHIALFAICSKKAIMVEMLLSMEGLEIGT